MARRPPPPSYHTLAESDSEDEPDPPPYDQPPSYTSPSPTLVFSRRYEYRASGTGRHSYARGERQSLLPRATTADVRRVKIADSWRAGFRVTLPSRVRALVRKNIGRHYGCCILLLGVWSLLLLSAWWVYKYSKDRRTEVMEVRVGIVEAGPAGIATAYALSKYPVKNNQRLSITLIEQSPSIGGRMRLNPPSSTHPLFQNLAIEDLATSRILKPNTLLAKRVEKITSKKPVPDDQGKDVGFFDYGNSKMIVSMMRPYSSMGWVRWGKLLWRYGPSVWRSRSLLKPTSSTLPTLSGKSMNMSSTLARMNWNENLLVPAVKAISNAGISRKYKNDILLPQLSAQTGGLHELGNLSALALSRALEAADHSSLAGSGGEGINVSEALSRFIEESGARVVLGTKAINFTREITEEKKPKRTIWAVESEGIGSRKDVMTFDHLVWTAPRTEILSGQAEWIDRIQYRSVWATFLIAQEMLAGSSVLEELLSVSSADGVISTTLLREMHLSDKTAYLYRIFSTRRLDNSTLSLFNLTQGRGEEIIWETEIVNAYSFLSSLESDKREKSLEVKQGEGLRWSSAWDGVIGDSMSDTWWVGENLGLAIGERLVAVF